MKMLIDTNIFLEIILEQEKAEEAKQLLLRTDEHELCLTDYSLHSIGLLLFRRKQHDIFHQFLTDRILNARIRLRTLTVQGILEVIEAAQRFKLDFDDAYQYVIAEKNSLEIISFDSDFDRTDRGRKTPDSIQR